MEDVEDPTAAAQIGTAIDLIGKGGNAALAIIGGVTKAIKEGKGGVTYTGVNLAAKPKALDFGQLAGWKPFKSKMYKFEMLKTIAGKDWGIRVPWWFEFQYGGYAKGAPDSVYVRDFRIELDKKNIICTYGWFCDIKSSLKEPPENVGTHERVIAQAAMKIEVKYGRKVGKKKKWSYDRDLYAHGSGKWA